MPSSSPTSTTITPEAELLLALGKPGPGEDDWTRATTALANPAFAWDEATRLARLHGVRAMLAYNLKSRDAAAFARLPQGPRQELGATLLAARTRRERYQTTVGPVFDQLAALGIPIVLMKGAILIETTYPPGARWLNDLDALVLVPDRSAVVDTFVEHGFRLASALPQPDAYHEVSLVHDGADQPPLCVDLHWDVYQRSSPFTFDAQEIIRNARPIAFGDRQALAMSAEATLVHYATQFYTDFFKTRLVRFADISSLLAGTQMERLVATASAAGAAGITHTALSSLALLGVTVPRQMLDGLARHHRAGVIGSELLADPRWVLNAKDASWGAMTVVKGLYLPTMHQRRRYWMSVPAELYGALRGDRSPFDALQRMVAGLFGVVVYGSVLLMLAGTTRKDGTLAGRMRNWLWRDR